MNVVDVASGKVTTRLDRVASFTVGGDGAGLLLYKREPAAESDLAYVGPIDALTERNQRALVAGEH